MLCKLLHMTNNLISSHCLFQMLTKKTHFTISLMLLAIVQSHADSTTGTGSFTVVSPESETNTAKPKTIYKPTFTRTELKVSRSLNPDSMQTLNVRTNDGGIATILVKKRDGKQSVTNEARPAIYDVSNPYSRGEIKRGFFGPVQVLERVEDLHQQQKSFENGRVYNKLAMQPVTTLQQQSNIRSPYRFSQPNDEKSINLINSFMKHVQQVESTRAARSPVDSSIPNDRATVHTKIPEPVTINSESVYVKDNQNSKRGRSLMEIDSDGIPLINGIRVPDDENDKRQTWRNARVINGILTPYENGYVPPRTVEYGQLIYPVKKEDSEGVQARQKSIGPFTTADNFSGESRESGIGPFSVTDMFTSRSNTKNSGIGPFSVADNSRTSNAKLIDYIKRINDQETRKDYFAGRVPKDVGNPQQIQRRMLINPGNAYFPPSSMYSVDKNKQAESVSTAPILQYAHPEFGLQSVGSQDEPKNNYKNTEYYTSNQYQKPASQNTPFYQIEPALNTREYYSHPSMRMPSPQQQQHPQMHPNYNNNYAYIRRVKPEQPFWMKLSEQFRDTFQNGFAQVHEIAKPVMDPIMEAGEKISYNLGFSSQNGPVPHQLQAQEKVGMIPNGANSKSYIFPALGMLAGGAALGLGAVAMGRIFDVSTLLQMRASGEEEQIDMDQQRALQAIRSLPTTTLYLVEDGKKSSDEKQSRSIEEVPAAYATSQPKANFFEVIAIPYENKQTRVNDSSIDPISRASSDELINHQRRKRNK